MKKFIFILFILIFNGSFAETYYSQIGQDEFMHKNFFLDKTDGTFVDIGAGGVKFSDSLFFERRGWRCVCIEPHPRAFNELVTTRACLCIQACVSDVEGVAKFLEIRGACEMLSGLIDKYDPRHVNRIIFEVQQNRDSYQIIDVPCVTLNSVLEEAGISHIDILKLDTEGGEKDILKSIDFERYTIDVICVEDNYKDPEFFEILEPKGFVLVKALQFDPNSTERELIFRNKNFLSN